VKKSNPTKFKKEYFMKYLLIITFLYIYITTQQSIIWKRYPERADCIEEYLVETNLINPRECVPLSFSRTKQYIKGQCNGSNLQLTTCSDSNCQRCNNTVTYNTKTCYSEVLDKRFVKNQFQCGQPEPLKPGDFMFEYYVDGNCKGKPSKNINRGKCITVHQRLSWRTFCDIKDGLIKSIEYHDPDCSTPYESSERKPNICQEWLGDYNVIFTNCTNSRNLNK
jgi:hypothetical protein